MATFNMPTTHLTTFDIGQLRPTYIRRMMKGWKLDMDFHQFSRMSPLAQPTMGAFRLKSYAFWVPFTSIFEGYERFRSKDIDPSSIDIAKPCNIRLWDIVRAFLPATVSPNVSSDYLVFQALQDPEPSRYPVSNLERGGLLSVAPSFTAKYDFVLVNESGGGVFGYNFTAKGRFVWQVLLSLGYELPTFVYWNAAQIEFGADAGVAQFDGTKFSATVNEGLTKLLYGYNYSVYPLLAFCRAIYDYIYPSQYVQSQSFSWMFFGDMNTYLYEHGSAVLLEDVFRLFFTAYEQDFFTTLWQSPNSVGGNNNNRFVVEDPQSMGQLIDNGINNTTLKSAVEMYDTYDHRVEIPASALRLLQSVADFSLRNNIGGTRFQEWMKAHFGLTVNEDNLRSRFLKSFTSDVNFDAVTSTSATATAALGEQAGQGYSVGNGELHFTAPNDGFLVVVSMLVPYIGYYQGQKPFTTALNSQFDLYLPDFDGVGFEPVPRCNIFSAYNAFEDYLKVTPQSVNDIFGWSTRYANSEKRPYDFLTGDFRLNSRNTGLSGYHTFRDVLFGRSNLALDAEFLRVDNQYNRIFENMDLNSPDHFITMFSFDCKLRAKMLPLSESMPFFSKDGEKTTVNYLGSQL